MATWSAGGDGYAPKTANSDATYVKLKPTDSAASGTAFASGVKTYDAAINVDMNSIPLLTITQRAESLGKSAGVVSTVQISHATPASMAAHNVSRNNYSAIAQEMILQTRLDVIMGAGHPWYDDNGDSLNVDSINARSASAKAKRYQYVGGDTLWNNLRTGKASGQEGIWKLIETKEQFERFANGEGSTPARLIGIAQVATTLQQVRAGGAADWAGHANQSARLIEEQMDFNVAVDSVIKWIEAHGGFEENLLIVTGDHETGYLTGENTTIAADTSARVYPVQNKGEGNMPGMQWNSGDHTNQLIPLFAKGAGSESISKQADEWDPQHGYFGDNAKVGQVMQMQYFLGTLPTPRVDEQVKTTQKISPLTTQLQVVGSLAMLQMSRSDVVRLSLYSTDGTRQHVLFNGYAQAGTQVFQIPRTTGIAMLVLETSTGKQVRNISNIK